MRIARDGTWYHQGSPIRRKPLVKLFSSVLWRDSDGVYWLQTPVEKGRILVEGKEVHFGSPRDALAHGIATVYQDLAMIPLMSIARNFFLGAEPTQGWGPFRRFDTRYADRVNVMYAGEIVESGTAVDVFKRARHPYAVGLLESVPRLDATEHRRLATIEGQPPLLVDPIPGCAFEPRCAWAIEKCAVEKPPLEEKEPGHTAACWRNPNTDEKTRIEQDLHARLEAAGVEG